MYLSGYSTDELPSAAADTLVCFTHTPSNPLSAEAAAKCSNLMFAAIKSMLVYPPAIFIIGEQQAGPPDWLVLQVGPLGFISVLAAGGSVS